MSALVAEVLWARWWTQRRDRWQPDRLARYQLDMLARLREYAMRKSPFYADHHRGWERSPLSELPPLTKATLMDSWDRLVTAPELKLASVVQRLVDLESSGDDPGRGWRGRWWTAATAGTTGERAVFVWDRREWVRILTSYARVNDWAQVKVGPRRRAPTAIVSTRNPAHQSAVVGASLDNPLVPTLRLDATQPIEQLVEQLNRFRPRLLVCYASMLGPLADAQQAGTLRISPEKVITASEQQLPADRRKALQAWGVDVVNTYAATETATIASACPRGSMHVYEDFVIVEPVDAAYQPVPDGHLADRLLVSVLFSRTLPLIRYELTDSIRLATTPCACGLPMRRLEEVAGRTEDTLLMPGPGGRVVPVPPNLFHNVVEPIAVHGWQVQQTRTGIDILIIDPGQTVDTSHLKARVKAGLLGRDVDSLVTVTVTRVPERERTKLGKAPLIRRL